MIPGMLTLAQAAQRVGLHRSNLLRAIKSGRISGSRDGSGAWMVDESELVRVFPEVRTGAHQPAQPDALLQLRLEHAEQRVCDLTRQLERAYADVADWKEQARRVALPAPVQRRGWWWRRTG
jgi:excisionase family DNA binding protein